MKHTMKRLLAVLLGISMLLALAACGTYTTSDTSGDTAAAGGSGTSSSASTSENGESPATLDTFTFVNTEPNTLNMIQSDSNLDTYVFYLISAMLFRPIENEEVPELCDTMEVSDDGCTYTYTIKEAYYTDGTRITADDFVYYMVKAYMTSSNYSFFVGGEDTYFNSLDTCEGIYALDESTFVITLVSPTTAFDGELEIFPLNQAFVEAEGDALGGTPSDLMYSGPYVLTDWVVGSSMSFEKNDTYINADTLFPTEHLRMVVSTDVSTTYSMYLNGEIDAILSANADLTEMLGEDNCTFYPSGAIWGLEFNTTGYTYTDGDGFVSRGDEVTALLQNVNFRKALCAALDRESIAQVIGGCTATNRYVSASQSGTSADVSYIDEYPMEDALSLGGDLDTARSCLAAALEELGYSDVSELPTITILTFETTAQKTLVETAVSVWKNDLGLENIQIDLQPIQSAIMDMVYLDYDIYLQQLSVNTKDMLEMLNYWITTGEASDAAGFQASGVPSFMASVHINEEYDALLADVYTEFDQAAYFDMALQAEQMLYDDFVYFPVLEGGSYFIVQDYVEGYGYENALDMGYSFAHLVVNAH